MISEALINKDIYPIEITTGKDLGKWIIYLPLTGYVKLVSSDIVVELTKAVEGKEYSEAETVDEILSHLDDTPKKIYYTSPDENGLLNMMILPNNKCNFKCSYCYSAHGRSGKEITFETLAAGLDYFLNPERAVGERLTISVLGGGEPLLSWELLKKALDYAYLKAEARGRELPVSLVTNGSIISDDILDYCKSHKISLSVSFDILEDIQNSQRGSYAVVKDNINRFAEYGVDIALNTVITNANVGRMNEMIRHMSETLPLVDKVSFKLLISDNYFPTLESREQYYKQFVDNFFEAQDLAKEKGIYLISPYWNAVICLADRYCPGKFVVTSEGTLSICHCVSSSKDLLYDKFIFGRIEENGEVTVDRDKLTEILSYNQNKFERCKSCSCRWHCAGGCYADNCTIDEECRLAYCKSMRYFLERFLYKFILQEK